MLKIGDTAPHFASPDQDGQLIQLTDYLAKQKLVLYFYPKDDTPGCTIEANEFTQLADAFAQANTQVIGVSKDSCTSHQAFISKYGLRLSLLSDATGEVCNAYGVWQEKEKNGVKSMGIVRSTFVVDMQGRLAGVFYGVKPEGHAQEMLALVQSLS